MPIFCYLVLSQCDDVKCLAVVISTPYMQAGNKKKRQNVHVQMGSTQPNLRILVRVASDQENLISS